MLLLGILFIFILKVGLVTTFADIGDEFEVNGIKYKITSENLNEVEVIENSVKPTGDIVIPANVNSYTVTGIGDWAFTQPNASNVPIYYLKDSYNASYIENYSFPSNFKLVANTRIDGKNDISSIENPNFFENTEQFIIPNIFTKNDTHFIAKVLKPMVIVLLIPRSKVLLYKMIKQFIVNYTNCKNGLEIVKNYNYNKKHPLQKTNIF